MSAVSVKQRPGQLRATLTGPVLGEDTVVALTAALELAERTSGVRAFVIASDGPAFCTGMPLAGDRLTKRHPGRPRPGTRPPDRSGPREPPGHRGPRRRTGHRGRCRARRRVRPGRRRSRSHVQDHRVAGGSAAGRPAPGRRTPHRPPARPFQLALTSHQLDAAAAVGAGLADRAVPDPEGRTGADHA
ncbi:hypothetical protein ACRAWF_30555 [Streptomyces sp. L7]